MWFYFLMLNCKLKKLEKLEISAMNDVHDHVDHVDCIRLPCPNYIYIYIYSSSQAFGRALQLES